MMTISQKDKEDELKNKQLASGAISTSYKRHSLFLLSLIPVKTTARPSSDEMKTFTEKSIVSQS